MSGDYVQVTFIGGPLDLTRMAMPVSQANGGCYMALRHPYPQEHLMRVRGWEPQFQKVEANVVRYEIRPASRNVYVALCEDLLR